MNIKKLIFLVIAYVSFFDSTILLSQQNSSEISNDSLLSYIAQYQFGKDRAPLTEFHSRIINGLKNGDNLKNLEEKMLAVLSSDSENDGKSFICRQLSLIGTDISVPLLLEMLTNPTTSDMARYALEKFRGDNVDKGLIEMIDKVDSRTKIGIINTLGKRRSKLAVEKLSEYLLNDDIDISLSAISALGKIGDEKCAIVLMDIKGKSKTGLIDKINDASLKCADDLLLQGGRKEALEIYDSILRDNKSGPSRLRALTGLFKAIPSKKDSLLHYYLKMNDPELSNAAIGQLSGSDTATDYEKVIESFLNFSENDQAKLLFKAGEQQIMQFLPVARDMDNIKSAQVKTAALNYLTFCGDASDLSLLIKYAGSNDGNVRDAARNALYRIKGKDIDKGILDLAEDADPSARIELIKAIGERRIKSGYGVLKSLAEDENRRVRVESYSALSIIADPENISELLQLFDRIENEAELKRMENTLAKIALKKEDRNLRAKELIEAINSEGDFEKEMSLLRILGATGDPNAYNVIKNYLIDENEDIVKTAIQSLYNWPNIDPLADLIDIAEKSENEIHRVLALRGYINLVKVHSGEVPEKAADLYADALKVSVDDAEKKMILSGLAEVKTLAAANLAFSLLKDPNLKAEAEICLIDILNTVRWSHPDEAYDMLSDIAAEASTDDIKFQASTIMKRIARDK